MPKGKPKKGHRGPGGGRKKGSAAAVRLTVRGARSQTLTRCTKKGAAATLSMQEMIKLQSNINSLASGQLDHVFEFLGFQNEDEVSLDLELMDGTHQRRLVSLVDELCAASPRPNQIQAKVTKLTATQLEEVIAFLGADLERGVANSEQGEGEVTLNWDALAASRQQELDKLLDRMLSRHDPCITLALARPCEK